MEKIKKSLSWANKTKKKQKQKQKPIICENLGLAGFFMWFYLDSLSSGVHGLHLDEAKSGWDNPGVFFFIYIYNISGFFWWQDTTRNTDAWINGRQKSVVYYSKQKKVARQGHPESYMWDRVTANQSHWEELMYDEGGGGQKGRLVTFHRLPVEWLICYCCFALFSLHGLWDLSFLTRGWTQAIVVKVLSSNHWTTRDSLDWLIWVSVHSLGFRSVPSCPVSGPGTVRTLHSDLESETQIREMVGLWT